MTVCLNACHDDASQASQVKSQSSQMQTSKAQAPISPHHSQMIDPVTLNSMNKHDVTIWKDIPWVHLTIHPTDWQTLQEDVNADIEVPAYLSTAHSAPLAVDLEIHGYSSRQFPKQNLKIKLDIAVDLGLFNHPLVSHKLIFKAAWKDHSQMREALSWYALQQIGIETPALQWVHLYLNDQEYGLYQVVEPIDIDYLRRRGYHDQGSLYKAVNQSATFAFNKSLQKGFEQKQIHNDLRSHGTSTHGTSTHSTSTHSDSHEDLNEDSEESEESEEQAQQLRHYHELLTLNQSLLPSTWQDLGSLQSAMQALSQNPTLQEIQVLLADQIDLDTIIQRLAWMAYTQASDAVTQNFYLYNINTAQAPHWMWINWDADMSFSAFWKVNVISQPWYKDHLLTGRSFWSTKLINNKHIRSLLILKLRDYLQAEWSAPTMLAYMNELTQRLSSAIAYDLILWDRQVTLDEVLPPIYAFIAQRPIYLLSLLEDFLITADFDQD